MMVGEVVNSAMRFHEKACTWLSSYFFNVMVGIVNSKIGFSSITH